VERRILLETFADQLPPEAIRFSSKLAKIGRSENGETLLELVDGTRLSAKVNRPTLSSELLTEHRRNANFRIWDKNISLDKGHCIFSC